MQNFQMCHLPEWESDPCLRTSLHHSYLLHQYFWLFFTQTYSSSVFSVPFPLLISLVIKRNFYFSSPTRTNFQERPELTFAVSGPVCKVNPDLIFPWCWQAEHKETYTWGITMWSFTSTSALTQIQLVWALVNSWATQLQNNQNRLLKPCYYTQ